MKNINLLIGAAVLIFVIILVFLLKAHILTSPFKTPSLKLKSEDVIVIKELNKSGVKGTAQIKEEEGDALILVNLVGIKPENDIYMHIHEGKCPKLGKILFDLNSLRDEKSQTKLSIGIEDLKKSMPLSINVHSLLDNKEIEVACGDLE